MQAFFIFVIILFLFDLYVFRAVRRITNLWTSLNYRWLVYILFWSVPLLLAVLTLYTYLRPVTPPAYFSRYYFLVGLFILFYIPKLLIAVFHLVDDTLALMGFLVKKVIQKKQGSVFPKYRCFTKSGFIISLLPFLLILYGILYGRFDFKITKQTIEFRNLPASFDGIRIVHISDIHTGSFYAHKKQLKKALGLVEELQPDLVFFTGDLINNYAGELVGWDMYFSKIKARHGKYAVTGNHDYGDYSRWESPDEKLQNFKKIQQFFYDTGFRLLLNEHEILALDGDSLAIIGVENWGSPPFSQYGDLTTSMEGMQELQFKILLSHDPSHWNAEVTGKTDIDLTLSGHTHGMQFGIMLANFKWSPAKYRSPQWGGLYRENDQYLYVNRGLGFIGFPGRVGMPPEITVLTLRKAPIQ